MSFEQASLLILLLAMLVLFSLERIRIEVIAIAGLLAGYALGLYPADQIFAGFASPVVITVIEILLIVQVLRAPNSSTTLPRGSRAQDRRISKSYQVLPRLLAFFPSL